LAGGVVGYNSERGPSKDHFTIVIFHILGNNYGFSFLGPTLSQVSDYRLLGASSLSAFLKIY
jgi:hypothetical protein